MPAPAEKGGSAYRGQAIYRRSFLTIYDALTYDFNYPVLWRCSKARLADLYAANVSPRHLDVGVATGRLLDECRFPTSDPQITLMDLNANSLATASRRLRRYEPRTVQADALEPWPLEPGFFESVAMTNLLHCLPGAIPEKRAVFEHASAVLTPGGVCFGATILGTPSRHTRVSRPVVSLNNRFGVLSNLDDHVDDLDAALSSAFGRSRISVVGAIAFFTAQASEQ